MESNAMKSKESQKNTTIDQFELTARENNSLSKVFDLKYQRSLFSHLLIILRRYIDQLASLSLIKL